MFFWKAGVSIFLRENFFRKFVENFFENLRHFRDFFAVVFDTRIASDENYRKKVEKISKIVDKFQDKHGEKH